MAMEHSYFEREKKLISLLPFLKIEGGIKIESCALKQVYFLLFMPCLYVTVFVSVAEYCYLLPLDILS